MATEKGVIKSWFRNKLKPTQEQFWAWMDSYWHKDEKLPIEVIEGLDERFAGAATTESVEAVAQDVNSLANSLQTLEENKVDKVEGKQLSSEDYTTEEKTKLANLGTAGWKLEKVVVDIVHPNGLLYNWHAANDLRNMAAEGWRVPTFSAAGLNGDYNILQLACNNDTSLLRLDGTNAYKFNANPANDFFRDFDGHFTNNWTAMSWILQDSPSGGWRGRFATVNNATFGFGDAFDYAMPVRLVKESTSLAHGQSGVYIGNDGKRYRTICIGTQEWLADNLAETQYRNGDLIPEVTDDVEWAALTTGALCAYQNNWENVFTAFEDIAIGANETLLVEAGKGVEIELDPETKKIKLSANIQLTSDDGSIQILESNEGYNLQSLRHPIISSDGTISVRDTESGAFDLALTGGLRDWIESEYDYSATAKLDDDLMTVREIMPPPAAGMFNSIACSSDGRVVIAAAQGGRLWYSTNYGKSFNETRPAGDADKTWGAVKCSYDGRVIVAACNGGGRLWKSTDFCYSWSELQPAGNLDKNWGNCLAVSKIGTHIIAGALYGRLYKSDDSGETWSELQPKPATNWTWFAASVSEDGQTILAGTNFAGDVYLSKDGGLTFTQLPFQNVFGDLMVSADGQRLCVPNQSEDPEGGSLLTSFDGGEQFNSYNENYWMPDFFGDYKTTWMSRNGSKIAALINDCIALSNLRDGGEWTYHRLRMDSFPTIITGSDDGSIIYAAEFAGSLYRIDMKRINDPWQKIEVDVSRDTGAVDPYFEIGAAQGYLIVDEENGEVDLSGDTFNIVELNSGYDYLKKLLYLPASTVYVTIQGSGFIINNVTRFLSSLLSVKLLDLQYMEQLDEPMLEEFVDSLPQHQSPVGYLRVSIEVTDELKSIAAEKGWTLKAVLPS